MGFCVSDDCSDTYIFWQSTFGDVPGYATIDAQINYIIPNFKTTIKAGASNLTGQEYITAFGTGNIGS